MTFCVTLSGGHNAQSHNRPFTLKQRALCVSRCVEGSTTKELREAGEASRRAVFVLKHVSLETQTLLLLLQRSCCRETSRERGSQRRIRGANLDPLGGAGLGLAGLWQGGAGLGQGKAGWGEAGEGGAG